MRSCTADIVGTLHEGSESSLIELLKQAADKLIDSELAEQLARLEQLESLAYNDMQLEDRLEKQVAVEAARLSIMKFICKKMTDKYASEDEQVICEAKLNAEEVSAAKGAKKKTWWRKVIFGFFTSLGFLNNVLTEFFGFKEMLLTLLTGLISPVATAISAGLTLFNAALYVASDSTLLGHFFGIKFAPKRRELLEHINSQIAVNNDINLVLRDCYQKIPQAQREYYAEAIKSFNHHIAQQKATFTTPDYTTRKRICSVLITMGYILTIGAASFGALALLPYLGLAAISLGGIAVIALVLGSNIFSFYNYQARAIKAIVMPAKKEEKQLEKELKTARVLNDTFIDNLCGIPQVKGANEAQFTFTKAPYSPLLRRRPEPSGACDNPEPAIHKLF